MVARMKMEISQGMFKDPTIQMIKAYISGIARLEQPALFVPVQNLPKDCWAYYIDVMLAAADQYQYQHGSKGQVEDCVLPWLDMMRNGVKSASTKVDCSLQSFQF